MEKEKPSIDTCKRMYPVDDVPDSYDSTECQDCTNWNCIYMPNAEQKEEKFMNGELKMMFPDEIDDGFNFSDFGGN